MTKALRLVSLATAIAWLMTLPASAGELKVGDKAPDFTLQGADGKTYTLADFRGRQAIVLAWFPKANTPGCTTVDCVTSRILIQSFVQHGDALKKHDVTYFLISVDTLEDNIEFAERYRADFPVLADPARQTAEAYGVLGQAGLANRWTFYIAKDGTIAAIDMVVTPPTAAEDVAARLRDLEIAERRP